MAPVSARVASGLALALSFALAAPAAARPPGGGHGHGGGWHAAPRGGPRAAPRARYAPRPAARHAPRAAARHAPRPAARYAPRRGPVVRYAPRPPRRAAVYRGPRVRVVAGGGPRVRVALPAPRVAAPRGGVYVTVDARVFRLHRPWWRSWHVLPGGWYAVQVAPAAPPVVYEDVYETQDIVELDGADDGWVEEEEEEVPEAWDGAWAPDAKAPAPAWDGTWDGYDGVTPAPGGGDGTVYEDDGTVYEDDGTVYEADGTVYEDDGTVYEDDGTVYEDDGTVYEDDGTVYEDEGAPSAAPGGAEAAPAPDARRPVTLPWASPPAPAAPAPAAPVAPAPAAEPRGDAGGLAPAERLALEARVLELVNAERARVGAPPLRPDARLRGVARGHSEEMASLGYFGHESPVEGRRSFTDRLKLDGVGGYGKAGENLASTGGDADAAATLVQLWMDSPPHRRGLLDATYRVTGVGVAVEGGQVYATQLFADRLDAPRPPTAAAPSPTAVANPF